MRKDTTHAQQALQQMIAQAARVVFFGGAGVSTESGIPDFRSASGLYNNPQTGSPYTPEQILHIDFFRQQPGIFFAFYFSQMIYPKAQPNAAHRGLAAMEHAGKLQAVVTQNIDGLHQMAGSRTVIELHGSVHRNYCTGCRAFYSLAQLLTFAPNIPFCEKCGSLIKPDVVLYGEALYEPVLSDALAYITQADLLIVGGTSLSVYPAAGLIQFYKGSKLVLINRSETPYDHTADLVIRESIGKVLMHS